MNGLTISVDCGDLLAITLPRNAKYFDKIVVGTCARDEETLAVIRSVPNAIPHVTDAFYRDGAPFNKGLAVEECFDVLGREGWILVWDADILFPDNMTFPNLDPDKLYNTPRRILSDPSTWREDLDWSTLPQKLDRNEFPGYFQLFHASAQALCAKPWYGTNWNHAGGCDSDFQQKWPGYRKVRFSFDVLHLGEDGVNWHGRVTKRTDGSLHPEAARHREAQERMQLRRKQTKGASRTTEERVCQPNIHPSRIQT